MYILYNILILIVLLVFVLPYYTYRLFTEKGFALRFKQQVFGKIDDAEIAKVMRKDCILDSWCFRGRNCSHQPLG